MPPNRRVIKFETSPSFVKHYTNWDFFQRALDTPIFHKDDPLRDELAFCEEIDVSAAYMALDFDTISRKMGEAPYYIQTDALDACSADVMAFSSATNNPLPQAAEDYDPYDMFDSDLSSDVAVDDLLASMVEAECDEDDDGESFCESAQPNMRVYRAMKIRAGTVLSFGKTKMANVPLSDDIYLLQRGVTDGFQKWKTADFQAIVEGDFIRGFSRSTRNGEMICPMMMEPDMQLCFVEAFLAETERVKGEAKKHGKTLDYIQEDLGSLSGHLDDIKALFRDGVSSITGANALHMLVARRNNARQDGPRSNQNKRPLSELTL